MYLCLQLSCGYSWDNKPEFPKKKKKEKKKCVSMHGISKNEKNLVRGMYGPSEASYGYIVHGWGLQGVYKGLQGVYKGYLHYVHLKLLLM